MTSGSLGGSKVRSPTPSATKTSAFCNPPPKPVTTSAVRTGPGCCLAQLGSAAMLIGLAFGGVPSNLTTPFTTAAPALATAGAGAPAFTTCRLEIQIVNIRAITRRKFFSFIVHLAKSNASSLFVSEGARRGLLCTAFVRGRRRSAGKKLAVSPLIAGRERRPILQGCPPANRNVGLSTALGCKSPQIQSIPKCSVVDLSNVLVQTGKAIMEIGAQHGCGSNAKRDHGCQQRESFHY